MTGDGEIAIILLSIKVALVAILLMLPPAYGFGWLLARKNFLGKPLLEIMLYLPLVVPPVVTGWVLLGLFGRRGAIGSWLYELFGISLIFNWLGAALAAAIMALPLMVQAMRLSIERIDDRLIDAARLMGASKWRSFWRISIPLSLPGIIAGLVLGFARALGEFGATISFVSNIPGETRTLPLAIYSAMQQPDGDAIVARLALISIAIAFAALLAAHILLARTGMPKERR